MPGSVGTSRPKFEGKELDGKFPIAPISVVQFFGDPCKDVDVDLRVKKGTFLAHWPPGTERGGRIQWFKSDLMTTPPPDPAALPAREPLVPRSSATRQAALYLKHESHFERFLAYDAELTAADPVQAPGGPDEYTLQNLTGRRLLDVAVIAPADDGFRVGWLDELPAAAPEKKEEADDKEEGAKKTEGRRQEEEARRSRPRRRPKTSSRRPRPRKGEEGAGRSTTALPAEGDANVRPGSTSSSTGRSP